MNKRTLGKATGAMKGRSTGRKLSPRLCYIKPENPRRCPGECVGASTHWYGETCGYGKKQQSIT